MSTPMLTKKIKLIPNLHKIKKMKKIGVREIRRKKTSTGNEMEKRGMTCQFEMRNVTKSVKQK